MILSTWSVKLSSFLVWSMKSQTSASSFSSYGYCHSLFRSTVFFKLPNSCVLIFSKNIRLIVLFYTATYDNVQQRFRFWFFCTFKLAKNDHHTCQHNTILQRRYCFLANLIPDDILGGNDAARFLVLMIDLNDEI